MPPRMGLEEAQDLGSLASDSEQGSGDSVVSSRNLSPLVSPIRSPEPWQRNELLQSTYEDSFVLEDAPEELSTAKQRKLDFKHGLGLVVGLQIGSGIFASPNEIALQVGSVGSALIVWVLSGLLAWTGGASYAELGGLIPENGGTQAYLGHIFGYYPAQTYAWAVLTILKPGSLAIISIVFGEYAAHSLNFESKVVAKLMAVVALASVTVVNCLGTHLSALANTVLFVMKLMLILFIFVVGLVGIKPYGSSGSLSVPLFTNSSTSLVDYSIALYGGLWAYDGWDNVNLIADELEAPEKQIPRVISTAMPLVIVCYICAIVAYSIVLSPEEMDATTSLAITMVAKVLGSVAATITGLLIAASCLGAINASLFSSGRIIHAAAEKGLLPSNFKTKHKKFDTPHQALILQSGVSLIYVLVGQFNQLVVVYGAVSYIFYLCAVVGVFVLRYTDPNARRTYRVWLTTPLVFIIVSLGLILKTLTSHPLIFLALNMFIFLPPLALTLFKKWSTQELRF